MGIESRIVEDNRTGRLGKKYFELVNCGQARTGLQWFPLAASPVASPPDASSGASRSGLSHGFLRHSRRKFRHWRELRMSRIKSVSHDFGPPGSRVSVSMKLSSWATLAAVFVLAHAQTHAQTVPGSPSAWNRLVETTNGLLRRPAKRSESPPVTARAVKQATWNETRPQGKTPPAAEPAKTKKKSKPSTPGTTASSKRAPARDLKKPPRTLSEYMAQERP